MAMTDNNRQYSGGDTVDITWLGTAGFDIRSGNTRFLIDPFVSRNPDADPVQPLTAADLAGTGPIFISHGHFDHLMDVPDILARGDHRVHGSVTAGNSLRKSGVAPDLIRPVERDGQTVRFGNVTARAAFSRHVRFDLPLVGRTLARAGKGFFPILKLLTGYPCGRVLSWQFTTRGRTLVHFGSAGAPRSLLARLAPVDILLIPLQGHSRICHIAADWVKILKPAVVIPHHFDNFFPPLSRTVDMRPFVDRVRQTCPATRIIVPALNIPIHIQRKRP